MVFELYMISFKCMLILLFWICLATKGKISLESLKNSVGH